MKIIPLATTLALLSFISVQAFANTTLQPDKCPSVDAIKDVGLVYAYKDEDDNVYVVNQVNKYDTRVTWSFVVIVPAAKVQSEKEALTKAREALPDLSGHPIPLPYNDKWLCVYNEVSDGFKTAAHTPVT